MIFFKNIVFAALLVILIPIVLLALLVGWLLASPHYYATFPYLCLQADALPKSAEVLSCRYEHSGFLPGHLSEFTAKASWEDYTVFLDRLIHDTRIDFSDQLDPAARYPTELEVVLPDTRTMYWRFHWKDGLLTFSQYET